MTTAAIYCSKCRDNLGHYIARYKASADDFRRVVVTGQNSNGSFKCECTGCGHKWNSKSPEAAALFRTVRG